MHSEENKRNKPVSSLDLLAISGRDSRSSSLSPTGTLYVDLLDYCIGT